MSQVRIGISGWTYPPWRGVFFPEDLAHKRELEYASRQVNSIEINGTFYSLQRPSSFAKWHDETPETFLFSVKASRYITHIRRLKNIETPLANFFASGVLCLREKLGPFLWQFPPNFKYDAKLLEAFFKLLPRTTGQAIRLAKRHDKLMKGRTWLGPVSPRPLRHAMEIRHDSFENAEFIKQLRRHNIAIVVADTAGKWPLIEDVTSDFVYVRLHGDAKLYESGYTDSALKKWKTKIKAWIRGATPRGAKTHGPRPKRRAKRDVFAYFDNDTKVHAPYDAMTLAKALRLGMPDPPEERPDIS